jgi:2-oxoglutarate dehydrogenase E1 component
MMDAVSQQHFMKWMADNSYLFTTNAPFIEELYADYLKDPAAVPKDWRKFFDQVKQSEPMLPADQDHGQIREAIAELARHGAPGVPVVEPTTGTPVNGGKQVAVLQLINAYRYRGHQSADTDPVKLRERLPVPELDPDYHHLSEEDMDRVFNTGSLVGPEKATLREILRGLKKTYCGHIGAEYMHITSTSEKRWLQNRLESFTAQPALLPEVKRKVLERLIAAEGLEKYLHVKYVGQKRFSLEGGEALIPLLDELIQRAGAQEAQEVVLGMAHRGRLNVLINLVGKSPGNLFREFEGDFDPEHQGSGDVKYHLGYSSDVETPGGSVHLTLAFNPSHLEIIDPVVHGSVRARQHRRGDKSGGQVVPVLIHGDAAFAGQGVVMETLQMSQARGFTTGGAIHIIVNNQIGFTTSNPLDIRSTADCTEVAKMVQAPIFHVNGDDPEAVLLAAKTALDFRMTFKKDVVIDFICYRRHGHNEADEPKATQPVMYKLIAEHPPITEIYAQQLIEDGIVDQDQVEAMAEQYRDALDQGQTVAPHILTGVENKLSIDWAPYKNVSWTQPVDTAVAKEMLDEYSEPLYAVPEDLQVHPTVKKIIEARRKMAQGEQRIDWGFAELMAYSALLRDGFEVRLSGQDSGRGTFFHRHAVYHDQGNGHTYIPLQHAFENQPRFVVIDSLLSEEAVLGFEYGYSSSDPKSLVIWEAQFGDFANGAQVVIDQFISSGEAKWGRLCGLTMFLPHGYDGQGPEHSSARLERYLQLCAEDNMQVCMPSVPAQMFHLLRRQMLRPLRKPLIIMTPKSLLRHKASTSSLDDLVQGGFHNMIGETDVLEPDKVRCVIACSGKFYFELHQARRERGIDDIAIVRIEQLYPFPSEEFAQELKKYPNATIIRWVQEEPRNQGAWRYIMKRLLDCMTPSQRISYATRPPSASPAVGYLQKHLEQQKAVIDDAFKI